MIFSQRDTIDVLPYRLSTGSEADYHRHVLIVKDEPGCGADVGNSGGQTELNLDHNDDNCWTDATIQHEFLHVFGMFHMQERPDRDNNIVLNVNNIDCMDQFEKMTSSLTYNTYYDGRSFMHYENGACAKNPNHATFWTKVCDQ